MFGSVFTEFPGCFLMGPTAPSDSGGDMSPIIFTMISYVPRCMTVDLATGIAMQRSHLSAQVNEIFIWLHLGSLHSDHFKLNVGNCDMRLLRLLRFSGFSVRVSILGKRMQHGNNNHQKKYEHKDRFQFAYRAVKGHCY